MFPALIYASVRWRDGIIDAKTRLQPAQQKTKYLWRQGVLISPKKKNVVFGIVPFGSRNAFRKSFGIPKNPAKAIRILTEKEVELFDGVDDRGRAFKHKALRIPFFDCVVAKTNFFGYSWRIAPKARIDDGFLDITFFELSTPRYLLFFPLIYLGWLQRTQKHFKAKRVVLKGRDLPIQYNGEFLGVRDRVELKVLPKAVKILCPKR
jgi:diacylglycerol kinase family enzyme